MYVKITWICDKNKPHILQTEWHLVVSDLAWSNESFGYGHYHILLWCYNIIQEIFLPEFWPIFFWKMSFLWKKRSNDKIFYLKLSQIPYFAFKCLRPRSRYDDETMIKLILELWLNKSKIDIQIDQPICEILTSKVIAFFLGNTVYTNCVSMISACL